MAVDSLTLQDLLLKRRSLRRQLIAQQGLQSIRIAILGGSTTNELVDFLEIYLLTSGFAPTFYQSEYGRFYEDAVLQPQALAAFAPDLVYLHTSNRNLVSAPSLSASEQDLQAAVQSELSRYQQIWNALEPLGCQVIQNNFDLPFWPVLGNLDSVVAGGSTRFILDLNAALAHEARRRPRLTMQDIASLSAHIGLSRWFDPTRWFHYKLLHTPEAHQAIAISLTSLVRAIYGPSRKVLVLDLDNTLWGGVIGDDGRDHIQIGRETPLSEAYTAFQEFCLSLRDRGVLLAVCSKNDPDIARSGFTHPDSVLKPEHFSAFRANWDPKHENLEVIAQDLNLGLDSFVFVDDNPAERAIVAAQLPSVAVPDIGTDPALFPQIIQTQRYFEPLTLSAEDLARATQYRANAERTTLQAKFADYGEYLDHLEMTAEIAPFSPVYLDRITQLTNKTNQYNLTTQRYTRAEMERAANDPAHIGLYGRLTDRFGDNGLISVVLGHREADTLHIDLWLMSCRVLKRNMEHAMLDALVAEARAAGLSQLIGTYIPSPKNGLAAEHFKALGFTHLRTHDDGSTVWSLQLGSYINQNRHIRIR